MLIRIEIDGFDFILPNLKKCLGVNMFAAEYET